MPDSEEDNFVSVAERESLVSFSFGSGDLLNSPRHANVPLPPSLPLPSRILRCDCGDDDDPLPNASDLSNDAPDFFPVLPFPVDACSSISFSSRGDTAGECGGDDAAGELSPVAVLPDPRNGGGGVIEPSVPDRGDRLPLSLTASPRTLSPRLE